VDPENLVIGNSSNAKRIYIIDYGLSIIYGSNESSLKICSGDATKEMISKFASISAQQGNEPKAKDDLESIGYLILYFLKGSLPWQSLNYKSNKKEIINMKKLVVNKLEEKEIYSKEFNYS